MSLGEVGLGLQPRRVERERHRRAVRLVVLLQVLQRTPGELPRSLACFFLDHLIRVDPN